MTEEDLLLALQAMDDLEAMDMPQRHPLRTPLCPPLPTFDPAHRGRWNEKQRQHASECEYCQRTIARSWRIECPSPDQLAQYRADPDRFLDEQAMRLHLERDDCQRCALLMRSGYFKALVKLAALVQGGTKQLEDLRTLAQAATVGYDIKAIEQFAGEREPLEVRSSSTDGALITTLLEDQNSNQFVVLVESPNPMNAGSVRASSAKAVEEMGKAAGRIVQVELISKDRHRTVEVTLVDKGEYGSSGTHILGETKDYPDFFGGCAVIACWKDRTFQL